MIAFLKIAACFAGMLILHRLRVPLGLALLAGGIGTEFLSGRAVADVVLDLLAAAQQLDLWLLMTNIALIAEIGKFMAAEKNAQSIVGLARRCGGRHGSIISLIAIPAIIGLVPMPGGALFSAPLLGKSVHGQEWPSDWKGAVNYWFRHIMEYWWPLYPVVIVTLSMFTMATWQFMVMQIPFTMVSILIGYLVLLRPHRQRILGELAASETDPGGVAPWRVLLPIMLIVSATLILPPLLQGLSVQKSTGKLLAMLAGLAVGLGWIVFDGGRFPGSAERQKLFAGFFSRKTFNMLFTLAGVMFFQSLLKSSGLLPEAGEELVRSMVPIGAVVALLPFVAGLVTGIAIGFAGVAFPLVVGLLAVGGTDMTPMATLVLAFSMGYAGMMLSPVHLCFLLTKEYFSADFKGMYRYLVPCVASVMAFGMLLSISFCWLGW